MKSEHSDPSAPGVIITIELNFNQLVKVIHLQQKDENETKIHHQHDEGNQSPGDLDIYVDL
jgi:hypothetical protein